MCGDDMQNGGELKIRLKAGKEVCHKKTFSVYEEENMWNI